MNQYDLVIDLRAARDMGIQVPHDLLLRADEVVSEGRLLFDRKAAHVPSNGPIELAGVYTLIP